MTLKFQTDNLLEKINRFSFKENGDYNESEFGHLVTDIFTNNELFWKHFVTPMTKRVDDNVTLAIEKTYPRNGIDNAIKDLVTKHYSTFLNLTFAADCLKFNRASAFENFYTNLGSVCDLAEEFITQIYFLKLECLDTKSEVVQYLSKKKFLDIASKWYDDYYHSTYTHYFKKGKHTAPKLISRTNILDEYFNGNKAWKTFKTFSSAVRQYRNVIVHNSQIGSIIYEQKRFVPKKEKIGNYKKWHEVFATNSDRFKHDFLPIEELMDTDFVTMKKYLNDIWAVPYSDLFTLFYTDRNKVLLDKYAIVLE
jgi:hypothetical protein